MGEAELKAEWLEFAKRLGPVGMNIFGVTRVKVTEQGSADIRIIGLMLLARTLSNLKAAIVLTEGGFIVEAKVIARCCFENSYWVGALIKEGDKFRMSMVQHEIKHKRMRAQIIFSTTAKTGELNSEISDKLRQWMRDHKEHEIHLRSTRRRCASARKRSYMFYQHLSWDAHPSIETINRYYESPDADGAPGINVSPVVRDAEVIEMLNLMCLAVIGVFLGVDELLGQDNEPTGKMAAEYKALTDARGRRASNHSLTLGTAETRRSHRPIRDAVASRLCGRRLCTARSVVTVADTLAPQRIMSGTNARASDASTARSRPMPRRCASAGPPASELGCSIDGSSLDCAVSFYRRPAPR